MASRALQPRLQLALKATPAWRAVAASRKSATAASCRFASNESTTGGSSSKPIVLEKPLKFNPPSHGSRLRKNTMPKHYGGVTSSEERVAQRMRSYPGIMAPEGTWSHWFWHSKTLHVFITMGTLFVLGLFTVFMNYSTNSPFKHLLPPISDLFRQPLTFFAAWRNVMLLHEQERAERAVAHREQHQSDVMKRQYYMKMHGIEAKNPVTAVFGKAEERSDEEIEAAALGLEMPGQEGGEEKKPQRRKMWGIF